MLVLLSGPSPRRVVPWYRTYLGAPVNVGVNA